MWVCMCVLVCVHVRDCHTVRPPSRAVDCPPSPTTTFRRMVPSPRTRTTSSSSQRWRDLRPLDSIPMLTLPVRSGRPGRNPVYTVHYIHTVCELYVLCTMYIQYVSCMCCALCTVCTVYAVHYAQYTYIRMYMLCILCALHSLCMQNTLHVQYSIRDQ